MALPSTSFIDRGRKKIISLLREAATPLCPAARRGRRRRVQAGVTMTTAPSLVCRGDERAAGTYGGADGGCGREGEGEGGCVDAAAACEREVRGVPGAGSRAGGRGGGRRALQGGAREAARPHGYQAQVSQPPPTFAPRHRRRRILIFLPRLSCISDASVRRGYRL
jgi:hypothetical protein